MLYNDVISKKVFDISGIFILNKCLKCERIIINITKVLILLIAHI